MNINKLLNKFSNLLNDIIEQAYAKLNDPNVSEETKNELIKLLNQLNQTTKDED